MLPFRLFRWSLALLLAPLLALPSAAAEESAARSEPSLQVEGRLEDGQALSSDSLLQQGYQQLYKSQLQDALNSFQQAIDQYQQANNPSGKAAALLGQAETYLWLGQYDQELRSAQQALEIYQALNDRTGEAAALHLIGDAHLNLDQLDQGMERLQQALAIRREVADQQGEGWTLGLIGIGQIRQGELEAGLVTLQQSLVILKKPVATGEQLQQQYRRAIILAWAGNAYRQLEEYEKANQYIQEALTLSQSIGNRSVEILSQFILGVLFANQEQWNEAISAYQRAQTLAAETGNQSFQASAIVEIGVIYLEQSDYDQAIPYYQQALTLYRKDGNRQAEGETLNRIGVAYDRQEDYATALSYYQQALAIHQEIENSAGELQTLNNIARAYSKQENYSEAVTHYQEVLAIYRENDDRYNEAETLYWLGEAHRKLDQYSPALENYQQALEIYQLLDKKSDAAYALYWIGMLHFLQGESLRATALYAESIPFFKKAIEPLQQAQRIAQTLNNSQLEHDAIQGLFLAPINIGFSFDDQYQYSEAIAAYKRALDTLQEYQGRFPENDLLSWKALILGQLGRVYSNNTQYAEALTAFRESAQIAAQIGDFARQAESLQFLAIIYEDTDEYVQALEIRRQVLQIIREELPSDEQAELFALIFLGQTYGNLNQYSEELKAYEQSLQLAKESGIVQLEASLLNNIGITYNYQGQYLQALEYLQKAWEINQMAIERLQTGDSQLIKQLCGQSFADTGLDGQQDCQEIYQIGKAKILSSLGATYDNLGRYAEALDAHEQALANARQRKDRSSEALYLNNKSVAYLGLGDYAKATELLQQSLEIATAIESRSMRILTLGNLGYVYSSQGRYPEALEVYQQSLLLAREIGNQRYEATTLSNIGVVYSSQGNLDDALVSHQQAIEIRQKLGASVAVDLSNIGTVYRDQGNHLEALGAFEQALQIAESTGAREVEASVLANLASAYANQSDYAKAIELQQRSLQIRQEIGNRPGEIGGLMNLGWLNSDLGQYEKAMSLFQQALALSQEIGSRPETAQALAGLAAVYREQQQYTQALEFYQQALKLSQEMGSIAYKSRLQKEIGAIYQLQGKSAEAVEILTEALKIQQSIGIRPEAGKTLNHLGLTYASQGKTTEAINALQQAITIHREVNDRAAEAEALANLGQVFAQQDQSEVAIAFYKQSVNLTEQIRQGLQTLSRDQQATYTETVSDRYRELADLLIAQGRILEAQQVLDLLKVEELREFTRNTRSLETEASIALNTLEQEIINQYGTIIAFGQKITDCERTNCPDLDSLATQRNNLNDAYDRTVSELIQTIRDNRQNDRFFYDPTYLSETAREIVATPGTVLIYPFVQDDQLLLLWTAAGDVVGSHRSEVNQTTLAETVIRFRSLLQNPHSDLSELQATGQQLYNWLIRPIEAELNTQGQPITHLVFAQDRILRYLPMAALHDGNQYLTQRYQVSTILSAELTDMNDRLTPGTANNPVLGLGLSQSVNGLDPLPDVVSELDKIVRENGDDPNGIYPGQEFLDQAFNAAVLEQNLRRSRIVHIATHAKFVAGSPEQSYLVLGNGDRFPIQQIDRLGSDLRDVNLVVLSACETALGGPGADGIEVAGISSYFLAARRATAVMASLWNVNDRSTSLLMQQFYENLAQGMTKAEALRQAQVSLLADQSTPTEASGRSDVELRPDGIAVVSQSGAIPLGYSHPYYWAPFILIGNGL